jgi:hypothetical protein
MQKMAQSKDLIFTIAPYLTPYLELIRLTGDLYYFRKESTALRDSNGNKRIWHPKIEHKVLRDLHDKSDEILYVALPGFAEPDNLNQDDLLYIGCSIGGGARFWRGKINAATRFPSPKSCFHHEPMRRGRDGQNLESYLTSRSKVRLYTLTSIDVVRIVRMHNIQLPNGKYPAHQLERKILSEGFTKWKWNARS